MSYVRSDTRSAKLGVQAKGMCVKSRNKGIEILLIRHTRSNQATEVSESSKSMPHGSSFVLNVFSCSYKEKTVAVKRDGRLVKPDVTQDPKFASNLTQQNLQGLRKVCDRDHEVRVLKQYSSSRTSVHYRSKW
jgi:hypothetical protein